MATTKLFAVEPQCLPSFFFSIPVSLKLVVDTRLVLHQIESRLGREPTSKVPAHGLVGELGLLITNLDCLTTQSRCGRIGEELGLAAAFQADEPTDAALNACAAGQQAVVGKNGCLSGTQGLGDVPSFLRAEHNSAKAIVVRNVLGFV